jgi:hypothetical protein
MERDSQYYIDKGFIDIEDDAEFRIMADAASCFGKDYKGLQRSYIPHPKEFGTRLWFPKLYENDEWKNEISNDETIITAVSKFPAKAREEIDKIDRSKDLFVIVFSREKGSSGRLMYRFKGEYQLVHEKTNYETGHYWKRIKTRVKTYFQD